LIGAAALAGCSWLVPGLTWVLMPLQYLNTHLHEFSHAFAAIITGGMVDHIQVSVDGSGLTYNAGGIQPIIASAGYVGAACIGAAMVALATNPAGAKLALRSISAILVVSLVLWVRGDWMGFLSAVLWAPALWILGGKLNGPARMFTAQFLGLAQCLTSVQAFLILLRYSAISTQDTDAKIMESLTGVPGILWASLWFAISLVLMGMALKLAWNRSNE
jgi:hypothetical protein